MPKKKKIPKNVDEIFEGADKVLEDQKEDAPPESGDAAQSGVRKLTIGEQDMSEIESDDYGFTVGIELKKELRAGMNIKIRGLELFRPAETVKIWTSMNFDKRKITLKEAFDWLYNKVAENADTLPVFTVEDTVNEAKGLMDTAPAQTRSPRPPPPAPLREQSQRGYGRPEPVPDPEDLGAYRDIGDFFRNAPRAPPEWRPRSPFQASRRDGFFSCALSRMDETELAEIQRGEYPWAWVAPSSTNREGRTFAPRVWYHG
jgi:hypothetical protein